MVEFCNRERFLWQNNKVLLLLLSIFATLNMATICRGILYTNYIWSYYQDKSIFRIEKRSSLVGRCEYGGSFLGMFYYHHHMRLVCRGVYSLYDVHKQMDCQLLCNSQLLISNQYVLCAADGVFKTRC